MITREAAVTAIKSCQEIVKEWEAWKPTEDEKHRYENMMVKPLGDEVVQALSALADMFFTTEVANDAWAIAMASDKLRDELRRWLQDRAAAGDGRHMPAIIDPRGSAEIWQAYREIVAIMQAPAPKKPPSAKMQKEMGSDLRSIAMALGWWSSPNMPDIERVRRELVAKPEDEEYDPSTWVHPRERQRMKELKIEWEARCERMADEFEVVNRRRGKREPCKDSVEQLANLPNMSVRQIALMKCMTEDAVRRELAFLGMVEQGNTIQTMRSKPDRNEDAEALRDCDPHDECGTDINARIIAMHLDGVRRKYIHKKLTMCLATTVSPQKVARVIQDYEKAGGIEAEALEGVESAA